MQPRYNETQRNQKNALYLYQVVRYYGLFISGLGSSKIRFKEVEKNVSYAIRYSERCSLTKTLYIIFQCI